MRGMRPASGAGQSGMCQSWLHTGGTSAHGASGKEGEMKSNPADTIKDTMWHFLMTGGQKANIQALREYVYDLIGMTTQKTAGQERHKAKTDIPWSELDMTIWSIVCEAVALVLSGELDRLEDGK